MINNLIHKLSPCIKKNHLLYCRSYHKQVKGEVSVTNTSSAPSVPSSETTSILLYEGHQEIIIRGMLGAGLFNLLYWTFYLSNSVILNNDLSTVGDPQWGYVGAAGTAAIFYFTKSYANHAIRRCFVNSEGTKMIFEMYSMIGGVGPHLKADITKVRFIRTNEMFTGSYIPIRIEGHSRNILFLKDGKYYDKEKIYKFISTQELIDAKEKRIQWRHQSHKHNKYNKS